MLQELVSNRTDNCTETQCMFFILKCCCLNSAVRFWGVYENIPLTVYKKPKCYPRRDKMCLVNITLLAFKSNMNKNYAEFKIIYDQVYLSYYET